MVCIFRQVGEKLSIDIKKLTSEELSTSVGSSELETCKQLCLKLDTELQHRIELCVNPNNFHHVRFMLYNLMFY